MRKAESEVRSLFEQYNDKLLKRAKKVFEQLNKWRDTYISEIQDHVNAQKILLEQYFGERKRFLEFERKRLMTDATTHDKKRDAEQIERLLAECRALKLNLPVLYRDDIPTIYMRASTEDQVAQKKSNENSASQSKEYQAHNVVQEDNDTGCGNAASGSRSFLLRSESVRDKSPREGATDAENSSGYGPSISGDENSRLDVISSYELINKCPTCYMIFPKSMKKEDRDMHVNEHYQD